MTAKKQIWKTDGNGNRVNVTDDFGDHDYPRKMYNSPYFQKGKRNELAKRRKKKKRNKRRG